LPSYEAGLYAGISLLGKIVFFASSAVVSAMFPMVAEKHFSKEKHSHLLYQSLIVVTIISLLINLAYALFPRLITDVTLGKTYISIAKYVPYFGISMLFLSVASVFFYYFLSLRLRKLKLIPLYIFPLMVLGFFLFHDSLKSVVLVQMLSSAALLVSLVAGYIVHNWQAILSFMRGRK